MSTVDFPVLAELEDLIAAGGEAFDVRVVRHVSVGGRHFPVYAVGLGNTSPGVPGFFGGTARGVPPPYYLLAMSLGAMAAVAWAHRHPDEVRGCVLINTSLRPFSPFYRRLRPRNYLTLLKLALLDADAAPFCA